MVLLPVTSKIILIVFILQKDYKNYIKDLTVQF